MDKPLINQINARTTETLTEYLDGVLGCVECLLRREFPDHSPIEEAFLFAMVGFCAVMQTTCRIGHHRQWKPWPLEDGSIVVCAQFKVEKFRCDFMIYRGDFERTKTIVECDGHDFHERTKEQAESDRSRDRRLQELGFRVFRFTGREIHRNAVACAEQVFDQVSRLYRAAA